MIKKLNEDKRILYLILIVLGIFLYFCLGQEWVSIQDDSEFYLKLTNGEGVMPLYPSFLFGMKVLLGESNFLNGVVMVQSINALVCTLVFVCNLQKRLKFCNVEAVLLYLACAMPFCIYLPESGITHQIMTEGLSYAWFYLFMLCVFNYYFSRKLPWAIAMTGMAVLLAFTRSQMLFLLGTVWLLALAVCWLQSRSVSKTILTGILGIIIVLLLVMGIFKLYYVCKVNWYPIIREWGTEQEKENKEETEEIEETEEETEKVSAKQKYETSTSQLTSILVIRGLYEVDAQDIELFESEEMKEIFQRVYKKVDEGHYRYTYAGQDLYMWEDLIHEELMAIAATEASLYAQEHPEWHVSFSQVTRELGLKVLLAHFPRYLYHTIRLMIPSFISSVFFQIKPFYLLCHFITLFLFLYAIGGSVYCIRRKRNTEVPEFMLITVLFIIMMVVIINIVFMGLQRYMVYAMGIFYCGLYLITKEIFMDIKEQIKGRTQ